MIQKPEPTEYQDAAEELGPEYAGIKFVVEPPAAWDKPPEFNCTIEYDEVEVLGFNDYAEAGQVAIDLKEQGRTGIVIHLWGN